MELRQMQYLIAIYEHGGVSAAAEKLFLTPQALSKSIRKLEEELDAPLFYREKNSLILTPFGKKVLPEVQRLGADYEDMMRRLEQISAQERGRVRLAFSHGVPNALSLDSLRSFEEAHPEAVVDMVELPDLLAEDAVRRETADIGFSIGVPQPAEQFEYVRLRHYQLCAVVHPDHPLAGRESLSIRDLEGQPLVTKNPYFKVFQMVEDCAERAGVELTYALRSPDEILWLRMLEDNRGVGIGVSFLRNPKKSSGSRLVHIPFDDELSWDINVIVKRGHYLSRTAGELLEHMKGLAEE